MLDINKINQASALRGDLRKRQQQVRSVIWQDSGASWSGSVPVGGYSSRQEALNALKQAYSPVDIISDINSFHLDAIEGDWSVSLVRPLDEDEQPTNDEQALINRAEALLTTFWDDNDVNETLMTGLESILWANVKPPAERPLCVSPQRLLLTEAKITAATPEEVTPYIAFETPSPLDMGPLRDDNGKLQGYYYRYRINNHDYTEICGLGKYLYPEEKGYGEHTFVVVYRQGEVVGRAAYDLGGWLLHNELTTSKLLITDSLLSEQRGLNTANTLKKINLVEHGYSSRDVFGVDIPGEWVVGGERGGPGGTVISEKEAETTPGAWFRAIKMETGPNITSVWEGTPIYDSAGNVTGRANPSVVHNEPSSSTEFRDSIDHTIAVMYRLAKQTHRNLSGDGAVSEDSRVQAENGFIASLESTKRAYESGVAWVLSTVLRLSATISGAPALFDSLRVVCTAKRSTVQPTVERVRALGEAREKGLISTEQYLEQAGLSADVDADIARMQAERVLQEGATEKVQVLLNLLAAGVLTTDDIRAEAVKLGLVEDVRQNAE